MSTTELVLPAPSRVGQGTAVEQSRAVAEVQGAIVVAQQVPRDITRAVADMYRSCGQRSLAERAFFRFPRGKETVSGPSVQLARELARCFGNMQFGVTELRRDDGYGQSEMQAWAWDVQTNTRSSTTFIVEHVRDSRSGTTRLTDQRDIYENNANMGARRLREMIFAILPGWFTEDAIAACYDTLAGGDGTLAERVKQCADGFAKLGVRADRLEQKTGSPAEKWTPYDLAQLSVIYRSIQRGETTKEAEFGETGGRVTASEIMGNGKPQASAAVPDESPGGGPAAAEPADPAQAARPESAAPERRRPITKTLLGKLKGAVHALPLGDSDAIREAVSALTGRPVTMLEDLAPDEAEKLLAVIDAELEAEQGDTEQAAAGVWRRVKLAQAERAAPDGGA